jgi:hypothetical protein
MERFRKGAYFLFMIFNWRNNVGTDVKKFSSSVS